MEKKIYNFQKNNTFKKFINKLNKFFSKVIFHLQPKRTEDAAGCERNETNVKNCHVNNVFLKFQFLTF